MDTQHKKNSKKTPQRNPQENPQNSSQVNPIMSRRQFIAGVSTAVAGAAAGVAALSPLIQLTNAEDVSLFKDVFQKHYKNLTQAEKKMIFARIEEELRAKYGVKATINDPKAIDGVNFGYALNIGRCIGCRKCAHACMKENNLSVNPQIQYIRVLKMPRGTINLEAAVHDYPEEEAGRSDSYYMPVQCQQCEDPPCVKVCPVKATWKEEDGPVVIDYNWCIGCRYCAAACPYHARRFNWTKPNIPADQLNPNMGYLSNRPRYIGVMEKCTFCLHRTRVGRYPACVEVCPTGARKFGNLNDPNSEVRKIIEKERVFILKQELLTNPKFYYVFAK